MGAKVKTTTRPTMVTTTVAPMTMTTTTPVIITATPMQSNYSSPTKIGRGRPSGTKNVSKVVGLEYAKNQMALANMRFKLNSTEEFSSLQLLNMWKSLLKMKTSKTTAATLRGMKKQVAYRYMLMAKS
jgi:hypothetical protein